jgi:murein DD-endopeptidase MepM/ murein hydrolase activator NlpD
VTVERVEVSRAELRRRVADTGSTASLPDRVDLPQDVEPAPAPVAEAAPAIVVPTSRRARRAAGPAITADQPAPPVVDEVDATGPDTAEVQAVRLDVPVVDADTGAMTALPEPTLGRRARRVRPQAQPAAARPDAVLVPAEPFELLEPSGPDASAGEAAADDQDAAAPASDVDAFAAAVALFSFTGETPVQAPASVPAAPVSAQTVVAHTAPRTFRGRKVLKNVATASFSVGVMGIVGLLTVGMTTPAEAVAAANGAESAVTVVAPGDTEAGIAAEEIQAYVAPSGTESVDLTRTEKYDTLTMAEIASESGIQNFSNFFVNDPNAEIQWPFAVGVPISYGFGMRSGRMHEGVDFTPGAGSPIQAIADGVVREATTAGGAYGVHVIIDHEIDGQLVSSHYAHMEYGSLKVEPGQKVTVGTMLGTTGNTGRSFGAHTHFEILMNGTTAIDPIPWLRQYAGG